MNRFTQITTLFLCGFFLLGFFLSSVKGNTEDSIYKTTYDVTIDERNPRLLHVKARFDLQDDVLYMSQNGAGQFPERWAKFVRNLKVTGSKGKTLKFKELPGAKWKIESSKNRTVTIEYEITLEHEKHQWSGGIDGAAFLRDWGVFYTGRSFLIMNGSKRIDIRLNFRAPTKWNVSASWNQTKPNSFIAKNLTDLSESMFFAGTHKEFSIKQNGFELLFALGGAEIIAQQEYFKGLARGVMDYYIDLMGGIPSGSPENRFKKSIVIINSGAALDGEVIGNHISMIFNPNGSKQDQLVSRFIFAHEFFHLWNGKSIRANDTTEDWFKEGISSYYTLKALRHVGAIDEEGVLKVLDSLFYRRYRNDKGYGKSSMRDVASGFNKGKHWGLIYGGGLFVGMCQDITIRYSTGNKRSLDDLMRMYFKTYGGSEKTYTTLDLQNSLAELSNASQADFFKQHVFGVTPIPIARCLSLAGLNATIENGQLKIGKHAQSTGLQRSIQNGVLEN
ncbi:MAG: hypothetical protein HKN25_06490 [Pyrinomonadaceae bacterium]|nr:hypothetical protein [Pyrinomonadaceae bacterium]